MACVTHSAACLTLIAPVYAPSPNCDMSWVPSLRGIFFSVINRCISGSNVKDGQTMISVSSEIGNWKLEISCSHSLASRLVLYDFQLAMIKRFFICYNKLHYTL